MNLDSTFTFEQAGWPALLVDSAGKVCRANPAALRRFGSELERSSLSLAAIWSAENTGTAENFLAQWERSPAPTVGIRLRTKEGQSSRVLCSVCSFLREDRKFFLLQLLPDISVPKPEAKELNGEASIALKQKLDCALQLARTVALDFNNALTSILGHTSHLLSQIEPNHPWRAALLEVEKSAARAAEIANDLGTFSRQDREIRSQAAGNLNLVLQRAVDFLRQNALPGITWDLSLEHKLFAANFEEARLQQALIKILENAVQATYGGSGRITVQTRNIELAEGSQDRTVRLPAGAYVCAEISDNGCGIPEELLPRIFEPFFTTKPSPHRGLGLAWVYGVVTNHGGGVAVSSQVGVGTSVRVYLPAEKRVVHESQPTASDLRGTETILVVDDEDLVLSICQTILSAYGYQVLTATSAQKALELLSGRTKVDLLVTDLVMPAMSGRQLIEHVQALVPSTRVLCTSGYVWPGGQEETLPYLQKPFTSQELLLKVKQVLAG